MKPHGEGKAMSEEIKLWLAMLAFTVAAWTLILMLVSRP